MASKPRNRAGMDAEAVARMMAAQDAEGTAPEKAPPPAGPAAVQSEAEGEPRFDPGRVDGRTLRRTGREPFATRIKPEIQARLKRIAYARGITIAEALELAVAAYPER